MNEKVEIGREELARLRADSAELERVRVEVESERIEFEGFHRERLFELGLDGSDIESEFDRDSSGEYIYMMALDAWKGWEERASRAIAQARHVPEGFVLVPVEPTEAMLRATGKITVTAGDNFDYMGRDEAMEAYRAMLSAAPKGDSHE